MKTLKLRHPATLAYAVTRIVDAIGVEAAAAAVGRSGKLVYHWVDPDAEAKPSLEQGVKLDAAFLAAGHGTTPAEAPIAAWYLAELDREARVASLAPSPLARVATIAAEAGDVAHAVSEALADGDLTPNERARIAQEAQQLRDGAEALIRDMSEPKVHGEPKRVRS